MTITQNTPPVNGSFAAFWLFHSYLFVILLVSFGIQSWKKHVFRLEYNRLIGVCYPFVWTKLEIFLGTSQIALQVYSVIGTQL